jgi:hypothetical protein
MNTADIKNLVTLIESYFFYTVIAVMPLFALVSMINRLRIKKVILPVYHGALAGFPLLPTVYAFVQLVCIFIGYAIGDDESVTKFGLYLIASLFWFVGAAASEQRILTEDGILLNINRQRNSFLRWNDVTDYFCRPKPNHIEYHFFRRTPINRKSPAKSGKWKVVVIQVQNRQKDLFEQIIKDKLDHRFEVDPVKIYRGEFKP